MAFQIKDIFNIVGLVSDYKSNKSESKLNSLWAKYNRQADMHALAAMVDRLDREKTLIQGLGATEWQRVHRAAERHDLHRVEQNRVEREAVMTDRYAHQEFQSTYAQIDQEYREAQSRLGIEALGAKARLTEIGDRADMLVIDRKSLIEDYGLQGSELDAMTRKLEIERGAVQSLADADMAVIAQGMAVLGAEQQQAAAEAQVGLARIAEAGAMGRGAVGASQVARGMTGSWAQTQRAAVTREETRQREQLVGRTGVAGAGFAARGAQLSAQRTQVQQRLETGRAGLDVTGAGLARTRAGAASAFARRGAEIGMEERQLGIQGAQARAARRDIAERGRGFASARGRARGEARREFGRSRVRVAALEGQAAAAGLEARTAATDKMAGMDRINRYRSDLKDANVSQAIAKWQKSQIADLPTEGGSSRGAIGLIARVGAELID